MIMYCSLDCMICRSAVTYTVWHIHTVFLPILLLLFLSVVSIYLLNLSRSFLFISCSVVIVLLHVFWFSVFAEYVLFYMWRPYAQMWGFHLCNVDFCAWDACIMTTQWGIFHVSNIHFHTRNTCTMFPSTSDKYRACSGLIELLEHSIVASLIGEDTVFTQTILGLKRGRTNIDHANVFLNWYAYISQILCILYNVWTWKNFVFDYYNNIHTKCPQY